MSYCNALNYLGTKTKVVELCNQFGGRVAVCPDWNGRVMTSASDGLDGNSYGLINVREIESTETRTTVPPSAIAYGGEDQLTLSPNGGPFSLYYSVKSPSDPEAVRLPSGYQEGPFVVDSVPPDPEVRMRRSVSVKNSVGAVFNLDIVRTVKLLESADISDAFGHSVAVTLEQTDVSYVGFKTINSMLNCGQPLSRSGGLVSLQIRSMFNSSPNAVAILPFREGDKSQLGPNVCVDFFGTSPHGRIRMLPEAALLRADSKYRCQVGVSRRRVLPYVGAIDFREGVLTLQTFDLPMRPWEWDYLSNEYCEAQDESDSDFVQAREFYSKATATVVGDALPYDAAPYKGEVARVYNNGPVAPNETNFGQYYEFDVYSPALELEKGEHLTHRQYTLHVNADNRTLAFLAKTVLGVDYDKVYAKMMR